LRNRTHRRHARLESWRLEQLDYIRFASRIRPSGRIRINAPQLVNAISNRNRYLKAAFRSPGTRICFQIAHSEVNVPGLLF
jgi:hypothetical protein